MQQLIRLSVDQYFERKDAGIPVEIPTIYTSTKALNELLNGFHQEHGTEEVADTWLDSHEYWDAFEDDEESWMTVSKVP
nr:hypothetical protein CFP56_24587 [Quercus suber]